MPIPVINTANMTNATMNNDTSIIFANALYRQHINDIYHPLLHYYTYVCNKYAKIFKISIDKLLSEEYCRVCNNKQFITGDKKISIQSMLDQQTLDLLPKITNLIKSSAKFQKNQIIFKTLRECSNVHPCLIEMTQSQKDKFENNLIEIFKNNEWIN